MVDLPTGFVKRRIEDANKHLSLWGRRPCAYMGNLVLKARQFSGDATLFLLHKFPGGKPLFDLQPGMSLFLRFFVGFGGARIRFGNYAVPPLLARFFQSGVHPKPR